MQKVKKLALLMQKIKKKFLRQCKIFKKTCIAHAKNKKNLHGQWNFFTKFHCQCEN